MSNPDTETTETVTTTHSLTRTVTKKGGKGQDEEKRTVNVDQDKETDTPEKKAEGKTKKTGTPKKKAEVHDKKTDTPEEKAAGQDKETDTRRGSGRTPIKVGLEKTMGNMDVRSIPGISDAYVDKFSSKGIKKAYQVYAKYLELTHSGEPHAFETWFREVTGETHGFPTCDRYLRKYKQQYNEDIM